MMEAELSLTEVAIKIKNLAHAPKTTHDADFHTVGNIREELVKVRQQGIREVVEWVNEHSIYEIWMKDGKGKWQAQLRIWFKGNPELLKEWGIE